MPKSMKWFVRREEEVSVGEGKDQSVSTSLFALLGSVAFD